MPTETELTVKATYKDYTQPDNSAEFMDVVSLTTEEITPVQPDMTGTLFFVVLLVAAGVWYWRKKKSEEKPIDVSKYRKKKK